MEEHRRERTRCEYSAHALVKSQAKGAIGGKVRDISIDALYLQIDPDFEMDEKVKVEIVLLGANSELTIKVSATVVRKDADGVAFHFNSPLEWWPIFTFFPFHRLDKETK